VAEAVFRTPGDDFRIHQVREIAIPGDLAQADDHSQARQRCDLSGEMRRAVADLLGSRLVTGRSAADDRSDPGMTQAETIIAGDPARLRGEAEGVQDRIHKVAGAIAGEGAACAIGAVGARRKPEDKNAGAGVAEPGNGPRPVFMVDVSATALLADARTVGAQANAALTGNDGVPCAIQRRIRGLEDDERGGQRDLTDYVDAIAGIICDAGKTLQAIVSIEYNRIPGQHCTGCRGAAAHEMDGDRTGGAMSEWLHRIWRRRVMRSGMVTGLVLAIAALGFIFAYRQHQQGNFHRLKERMATERPQTSVPAPGGQEAIDLTRTRMMDDTVPEFTSVMMLPGRGMNLLQIRAYIPGMGETDLLASPALEAAAVAMTGKGADAGGRYSLRLGGPFEIPWADRIWNLSSGDLGHPATEWEGHSIDLPAFSSPVEGGLMLASPSDLSNTSTLPDGAQAEATFRGIGEHWPSKMDVRIAALLSRHTLDLTVTVRNTGTAAAPVGIGWTPKFAIMKGARSQLRLRIPAEAVVEQGKRQNGLPTGKLTPVLNSALDYTAPDGVPLSDAPMDTCFADLTQGVMDNGPAAELIDPLNGYKLRLTALSSEIKAVRVTIPADGSYLSIGPQFNYPDPFGHEWDRNGSGMVVLQPGQSTQWKVRLEILPLASAKTM
jgi:aldose 1-epimerase